MAITVLLEEETLVLQILTVYSYLGDLWKPFWVIKAMVFVLDDMLKEGNDKLQDK